METNWNVIAAIATWAGVVAQVIVFVIKQRTGLRSTRLKILVGLMTNPNPVSPMGEAFVWFNKVKPVREALIGLVKCAEAEEKVFTHVDLIPLSHAIYEALNLSSDFRIHRAVGEYLCGSPPADS